MNGPERTREDVTAYLERRETGERPLPCGCCIVATEVDPVGPRLVFLMQRKDAASHAHDLADFGRCGARVKVVA